MPVRKVLLAEREPVELEAQEGLVVAARVEQVAVAQEARAVAAMAHPIPCLPSLI